MNKTTISEKNGIYFVGIFWLLLLMVELFNVSIPSLVFTGLWMLILILCDREIAAAFSLCSVICFASFLSISIPCVFYFVLTLLRNRNRLVLDAVFLTTFSVALIEFCRLFLNSSEVFKNFVNVLSVLFLVYSVLSELKNKNIRPEVLSRYFLANYVLFAVIVFDSTARYLGGYSSVLSGGFRMGDVDLASSGVGVISVNPNGIALFSIVAIGISLVLWERGRIRRFFFLMTIAVSVFVGFLTVSRTFVVIGLVLFTFYFFWKFNCSTNNILKPILLFLVVFLVLFAILNTDLADEVLSRFGESAVEEESRIGIIDQYLNYMMNHPMKSVFGVGLLDVTIKTGIIRVPHNAVVEIFVTLGFTGLLLYALFFVSLFRSAIQRLKEIKLKYKFLNFVPFLSFLLFIQGLQFLRISYIYALIPVVFACALTSDAKSESGDLS